MTTMCLFVCVQITCSDGYPQQIVYEGEHKIDPYPPHSLLGQLDAGHHVQQVILAEWETQKVSQQH